MHLSDVFSPDFLEITNSLKQLTSFVDSLALSLVKEGDSDVFSDRSNMMSGSRAGGGE